MLILTPLAFENEALRPYLGEIQQTDHFNGIKVHRFKNGLRLATGGHGKVQFALSTQLLARELSPTSIICAGACGGLDNSVSPLDVIAATDIVEHDFHLRFVKRPNPRFASDPQLLSSLPESGEGFQLHRGIIASGDEDILDLERKEYLHKQFGALGVAWESAGGARAAAFCKIPYLELRVVTDSCDHKTQHDFRSNIQEGMRNLAHLILSFSKK